MKYPDSVSRVRPPNTTMPNTLAALPRSQYATDFSLVVGKKPGFVFPAVCPIDLPKPDKGNDEPLADAKVFEVADDARLVLVLNTFVGLENASLKRVGRVTTRGRHGHCEH